MARGLYGTLIVEGDKSEDKIRDFLIVADDWRLENSGALIETPDFMPVEVTDAPVVEETAARRSDARIEITLENGGSIGTKVREVPQDYA